MVTKGRISFLHNSVFSKFSQLPFEEYPKEIRKASEESCTVLKPRKVCAILIENARKLKHYVLVAFRAMQAFLNVIFILKEDTIKLQWSMKITRGGE